MIFNHWEIVIVKNIPFKETIISKEHLKRNYSSFNENYVSKINKTTLYPVKIHSIIVKFVKKLISLFKGELPERNNFIKSIFDVCMVKASNPDDNANMHMLLSNVSGKIIGYFWKFGRSVKEEINSIRAPAKIMNYDNKKSTSSEGEANTCSLLINYVIN